ncbi:ribosome-associated protein YbcJ (S4-like RNA binding protein) [Mycoplasma testudineum]|uniref:Ribosome-associated protein YbcJ (S4-like RNA binding protein) n=1 Tax=Mycoplasma testudineum TaxID=244584 RepID=A0A4R6IE19_9MOLU|nr:RNA-binding S4 domain-containing protein [Mycoplasma testudineum]OYD26731.1 RNA-binding protein [Mycoplasma testudineum]TDO19867.1 ribosome-associated protein YbcJ (S4-like RNA binding protein) [Mycoplasma testudineum]
MNIEITGEDIKIGQLLKKLGHISTGGRASIFLENHVVKINGSRITTRSTKVKIGDIVWIDEQLIKIISKKE